MYLSYLVATGLTTGAIYALIALGLVVIYRATSVVNFAHGETFMAAGFVAWTVHVAWGWPYIAAFALAIGFAFLFGLLTYLITFKPLVSTRDLNPVLLMMIGVGFITKGASRELWGGKGDYLTFPPVVSPAPLDVGGVLLMPQQLVVLAAAIVVMIGFSLFFRFTRIGKFMQATADNPKAARLVGLRVDRIYMYTFGVGAAIAGISACLMAPLVLLYPDMGFALFIKGFAAAILGGLASAPGAIVGGLLLGVAEQLSAGYIATSLQEIAAFVVIFVALIFFPNGIFGSRVVRKI